MATPLLAGIAVAGAALAGRAAIRAWQVLKTAPARPKFPRSFLQGGFEPTMSRTEALHILGLREGAPREKVREAHRRLMRINHPDTGGSAYLAAKVNEAKEVLLGTGRRPTAGV
jgi:DnaJ family protein C protein 19